MAYALERGSSGARVFLDSPITIPASSDFVVEIKYLGPSSASGSGRPLGNTNGFDNRLFIRESSPLLIFSSDTASFSTSPPAQYFTDRADRVYGVFRFTRAGASVTCEYNDSVFHTANLSGEIVYDQFFAQAGSVSSAGDGAQYISITVDGVEQHKYFKENLSSANDIVWPDTVGGNDGTLVNFPTDNSQWVFYDDGGGSITADTAYTVNAPTFTSSASVTIPAPIANGAFSIASPLFSASADASLPQPIANAAFTLNAPAFSATASVEAVPSGDLYYLNFATDGYVSFSPLVSDIGADYSWDIEFRAANNQPVEFILLGESSIIENVIVLRSDNTIDYRVNSLELGFPVTDITDESAIYRFEARGGDISLYENGALKATRAFSNVQVGGTSGGFTHIGDVADTVTRGGALYYLKYTDNNNPANNRFFNPSASNGTGDVLPDTISGLDATQVGTWPSDDSEWVQYASATPSADVSFTLNAPVFTATAGATLPQPSASIEYSINAPTFAADAAVTLPQPTADVTYTVTAPTFSVDSAVTLPQPTANAAFSLPAPTFAASATATQAGFNASVNFTLPAPTFSADTTATLPQPIADGNFTVTVPTFSVVAIAGGIAIIVDNETNINMPALSTNINAPVLSNNVRI